MGGLLFFSSVFFFKNAGGTPCCVDYLCEKSPFKYYYEGVRGQLMSYLF